MAGSIARWASVCLLFAVGAGAACGSSKATTSTHGTGASGTGGETASGTGGKGASSTGNGMGGSSFITSSGTSMDLGFDVEPEVPKVLNVTIGQSMPTLTYTATLNGNPVKAGWTVDQGNIGTIAAGPAPSALFAPTGSTGGVVNVLATTNGMTLKRQVTIKLSGKQNGANPTAPGEGAQTPSDPSQLSTGGGVGGVGGEGLGSAVTDMPTLTALQNPQSTGQAQGLTLLYPYDKTVWPRGMLAPLLMWSWTPPGGSAPGDADAIEIKLTTTTGSFSWTGTFGRPAILAQTGGAFIRHPIPQDVWDMATNTAGGTKDKLTVMLTVAKGGIAYGPILQTWTIATARLTGSVYYNSYGTQLVFNWGMNRDAAGNPIGAAILGVRSGDVAPTLVVGQPSANDDSGCRVCHTVASKGRWLLTQSEQGTPGDGLSFLYDLSQANVPASGIQLATQGTFGWAALTGDASYALTNEVNPSSTNPAIGTSQSSFWNFIPTQPPPMTSPTTMPATGTLAGLPSPVAAGYPSYAPDDKRVAYMDATTNQGDVAGEPIVTADYDPTTQTFSNPQTVVTAAGVTTSKGTAALRIGYPVFLPDDSGILFEAQVRKGCSDTVMVTRNGTRSELWWTNLGSSPMPVALATLNGTGYLPTGGNNHGAGTVKDPENCSMDESTWDDTTLDYEPTVLPIVSGGYAWVVLTSRRLYGNQLTATPWQSWPQDYDTRDLGQATVKKLWVAAIDLNAPPGTDPSHPAFYLPAQEILAGNSRGFWVLDPCKADGSSCESGDQCCNGYCEPNGQGGALICSNAPPGTNCSMPQEKCTTAADCCDPTNKCINGFCAQTTPG